MVPSKSRAMPVPGKPGPGEVPPTTQLGEQTVNALTYRGLPNGVGDRILARTIRFSRVLDGQISNIRGM